MSEFYTNVARHGKNLLYRGIKDGKRVIGKVPFSPTLFVKTKEESEWKSLWGDNVKPKKFQTMSDAKAFYEKYDGYEGMEIFGMEKYEYQFLIEKFPGDIHYDLSKMNIVTLDIETTAENGPIDVVNVPEEILLISMQNKVTKRVTTFGSAPYDGYTEQDYPAEVDYRLCANEEELLKAFILYWESDYPDIVTGWNTDIFDIPYLANRIFKVLGEDWLKKMSPWGIIKTKNIFVKGKEIEVWDFVGVTQLDYIVLYKKFSFTPQESYSLDNVSFEELGARKLKHSGTFRDFYTKEWQKFVTYNVRDCQLVDMLDDKFKFIELCLQVAYMAKMNISDVFSPVKTWDIFIYSQLHLKKIAIPQHQRKVGSGEQFEGAWVKEPLLGMMRWVLSFDATALYPSDIKQWNISPEKKLSSNCDLTVADVLDKNEKYQQYVSDAKAQNFCFAANGAKFSRDGIGILPELLDFCLSGRKIAKKTMLKLEQEYLDTKNEALVALIAALDGKQMALKILANSLFGACGNAGFRYFDIEIAEAITTSGQWCNRTVMKAVNQFLNTLLGTDTDYIITGDTDSIYVNFGPFVDKFFPGRTNEETTAYLLKVLTKIQEVIAKSLDEVYDDCNGVQKSIYYKPECVASQGFWTAKKRYALRVYNSEGVSYNPPKIKVMGLDIVKTSTPAVIRKKLKDCIPIIFDAGESAVQDYVKKVYADFLLMTPEEIAFPRGVSEIDKWLDPDHQFKSGCPIGVRASILYNNHVTPWSDRYQNISEGDKIRYLYLKMPNPIKANVIGFPADSILPPELKVTGYIDMDIQFQKTFLNPVEGMITSLGWTAEPQSNLSEFFG